MGLGTFVLSLVFLSSAAFAEGTHCLPEYTSLRAEGDFSQSPQHTFVLKSENSRGLFESKARLTATVAGGHLSMKFHWDENFSGVSLPYNLFSVLVLQGDTVVGWMDFTRECQGPGVGFFPGQSFTAQPLKVDSDGPYKFIVWGRIN